MFSRICIIATIMSAAFAYPLFKQCDDRWRNDKLGTSSKTFCQAACLMVSVAMVLNDCDTRVDGKRVDP